MLRVGVSKFIEYAHRDHQHTFEASASESSAWSSTGLAGFGFAALAMAG